MAFAPPARHESYPVPNLEPDAKHQELHRRSSKDEGMALEQSEIVWVDDIGIGSCPHE